MLISKVYFVLSTVFPTKTTEEKPFRDSSSLRGWGGDPTANNGGDSGRGSPPPKWPRKWELSRKGFDPCSPLLRSLPLHLHRLDHISFLDFLHDIHSGDRLAEDGVVAVELCGRFERDIEL